MGLVEVVRYGGQAAAGHDAAVRQSSPSALPARSADCRCPSWSRGSSRSTHRLGSAPTATGSEPGERSTPSWCWAIPSISILEGVILPWGEPSGYLRKIVLPTLAKAFKFDLNAPWGEHSEAAKKAILHGAPGHASSFRPMGRGAGASTKATGRACSGTSSAATASPPATGFGPRSRSS